MAKKSTAPSGPSFETGMLAFARSVQVTEGLFFATKSSDSAVRTPIEVLEKGVRGQSSEDKAKNPGKSNPQSVEYAVIPQDHDGVELSFSIRFMPLSLRPHACDKADVVASYVKLAEGYRKAGGYRLLAERFVWNIANARFAWRNRYQSDEMSVTVKIDGRKIVFDPFEVALDCPVDQSTLESAMMEGDTSDLTYLFKQIEHGLSNDEKEAITVEVRWNAVLRPGQEIFPSQEYVRDEKKDENLSRVYAKLPTFRFGSTINQASMHSQKIGAALRHIDTWHDRDDYQAIAVNPYGGVQETGDVLREGQNNFYALRKKAESVLIEVEKASNPNDLSGDIHFIMANLVRGGVFGNKGKSKETN